MTMSRLIVKALLHDIISPNISISRTFSVVEIKGHNLNSLKRFISHVIQMGVSENDGTPKSSILIGCSFINHPFWGIPIFGNTQIVRQDEARSAPKLFLQHP